MAQTIGLIFPLVLVEGKPLLVSGSDLIQASIKTIITWPLFTRFYNSEFGSRIFELLEEPNDGVLIKLTRRFVIDSISRWEKRVELISVEIYKSNSQSLVVKLNYNIKALNISDSFSQVFYTN